MWKQAYSQTMGTGGKFGVRRLAAAFGAMANPGTLKRDKGTLAAKQHAPALQITPYFIIPHQFESHAVHGAAGAEFSERDSRFNWVCHAYCQMTNHSHLVIETPDANLSKGMRQVNGVYTQRFNCSHQRAGHVFQGRFQLIPVEKDSYLLELACVGSIAGAGLSWLGNVCRENAGFDR